jgi:hypothetical protein
MTYTLVSIVSEIALYIVARGKINSPDTQIHDLSLSWFGTGTSIKSVGVKQIVYGHKP